MTENEFVVEKVVQNHSDDVDKNKNTGAFNEVIIEWQMDGVRNIIDKFVERSEEAKEPSETGADDNGKGGIPDEEIDNTGLSRGTLLPSDARMKNVGENSGNGDRDKRNQPEEITVVDKASNDGIKDEVKKSKAEADDEEFADAFGGGVVF